MMPIQQEKDAAAKICNKLLSREAAWDQIADPDLSKSIAYYQALKVAFTSSPLRQPLLQDRVMLFIDKRLSDLVNALLGPTFKYDIQSVMEEVEAQEG